MQLTFTTSLISSKGESLKNPFTLVPTLFIKTAMSWYFCRSFFSFLVKSSDPDWQKSHIMQSAETLYVVIISSATFWVFSLLRAIKTTLKPKEANFNANSFPMPSDEPVTTAHESFS